MEFTPQNRLEEIFTLASTDPNARPHFYEALLTSDLYVIQATPEGMEDGPLTLQEGDDFSLSAITMDGEEYIPAFTSEERISEAIESGVSWVALNGHQLLSMVVGEQVFLNPGSSLAKKITAEELDFLLKEAPLIMGSPEEIEPSGQILMGTPEVYPKELVQELSALFSTIPEVLRAWVANVMIPGEDQKPHSLVALEVTDNIDDIVGRAAQLSLNMEAPDPPVDYLQVTGQGGLEDYFLEESSPFYEKEPTT